MQALQSPEPLGSALTAAYDDALSQWLKEYRRGRDSEVAITQDLTQVTLSATLTRRRVSRIYVTCQGRQPWMTATYPFILTHHTGDRYAAHRAT